MQPELEIIASPRTVGDERLDGMRALGHIIYRLQMQHDGRSWTKEELKNYLDAFHLIQARFAILQEELNWALFSPFALENRGRT